MDTEKHSGYGIVSFILSCISIISLIVLFIYSAKIEAENPEVFLDETSFEAMIAGLVIIAIIMVSSIGFGFGIAGLFQKNRKKVFSVLGTILSLIIVLLLVSSILFGIYLDPSLAAAN